LRDEQTSKSVNFVRSPVARTSFPFRPSPISNEMSDDSSNHADDRIVTSEQWDRLTRLRSPSSYPEEQVQEFVRKLDQNALFHSHYYAEALSRASTQAAIVPPSSTSNPDVAPSLSLTTNWNFSHSICSTPFVLPNPLPTVPRPIGLADDRPYTFDEWKNREGEKLRQKRELTVEASVNITTRPSEADVFWDKSTGAAATKDEIKQIKKEETELLDFILDIAPTDPDAQKRHLKLVTFVILRVAGSLEGEVSNSVHFGSSTWDLGSETSGEATRRWQEGEEELDYTVRPESASLLFPSLGTSR